MWALYTRGPQSWALPQGTIKYDPQAKQKKKSWALNLTLLFLPWINWIPGPNICVPAPGYPLCDSIKGCFGKCLGMRTAHHVFNVIKAWFTKLPIVEFYPMFQYQSNTNNSFPLPNFPSSSPPCSPLLRPTNTLLWEIPESQLLFSLCELSWEDSGQWEGKKGSLIKDQSCQFLHPDGLHLLISEMQMIVTSSTLF